MPYSWSTPPTFNTVDVLDADDLNAYVSGNAGFLQQELPTRGPLWHWRSTVTAGNAIATTQTASQLYGWYSYQNAAGLNDSFTQSVWLAAGTYKYHVMGTTNNNRAIVTWVIDGTTVTSTQDWYAAGLNYNVVQTVTGVVIATGGHITITGTAAAKHASSSDYALALTKLWFVPNSD